MKTFEQREHQDNKADIFGYDDVYRLKDVTFNADDPVNPTNFDKKKSVQFDKVDNILKILTTEGAETTEINTTIEEDNAKLNQYTTFDQWGLDYDQNGNMTQKGTQFFTYDYRNQIVSVTDNSDSSKVNYKYDALGRRISKQLTHSPTHPLTYYYYSGNQVIEERDGSDQVLKQYVYGNGIDEVLRMDKYNTDGSALESSYYYHTNGIGSVTAITDQNGDVVERVSYDLYGMPTIKDVNGDTIENSSIGNEYMFQGRRYDKETNLYYFRARYYDPIMGRFLQTDPMGYRDSMNLYQAFNQNPVNFVDPLGLYDIDFHYYTVYYIMRAKGWGKGTAENIASWNQYIDDDPLTGPGPYPLPKYGQLHYHFPFSSSKKVVVRDDPRVRRMVLKASDEFKKGIKGSDVRLGLAMHMYADTWAHERFSRAWSSNLNKRTGSRKRPDIGHADASYQGKKPDLIILNAKNKLKAVKAALNLYDMLPQGPEKGLSREDVLVDLLLVFTVHKRKINEDNWEYLEDIVKSRLNKKINQRFGEDIPDYNLYKYSQKMCPYYYESLGIDPF